MLIKNELDLVSTKFVFTSNCINNCFEVNQPDLSFFLELWLSH